MAMDEAVRAGKKAGNWMIQVVALCHKAEITMMLGRLREAESLYRQALAMTTDERGRTLPAASFAQIGLGELLRERNELDAAEALLEAGIRQGGQSGILGLLDGYIALARLRQGRNDPDGATQAIRQAEHTAAQFDTTEMDDQMVALYRVRIELAQGHLRTAQTVFDAQQLNHAQTPVITYVTLDRMRQIVQARLLIAGGQPGAALDSLRPLLPALEEQGWTAAALEVLALRALAHQAQGDHDQAIMTLGQALTLAEPEGYARLFLDEGDSMRHLLREAMRRGIVPEYARRLLAGFDSPAAPITPTTALETLVEPLSDRELAILRLIAEDLTNAEIAARLFISVPTVKWHTTHIFGKLGVERRSQAVTRARKLGLLPDSA
jgi:LuxR family maltose regulon positive regulatory protein